MYVSFLETSTLLYSLGMPISHLLYSRCVRVQQYQQTPAVLLKAKRGCKRVAFRSLK